MVNFITKGKMGRPIKEIGNKVKSMDMAFIIGLTVVHIKDNMQMVKDMERELWNILMGKSIMENGFKGTKMEKDI